MGKPTPFRWTWGFVMDHVLVEEIIVTGLFRQLLKSEATAKRLRTTRQMRGTSGERTVLPSPPTTRR